MLGGQVEAAFLWAGARTLSTTPASSAAGRTLGQQHCPAPLAPPKTKAGLSPSALPPLRQDVSHKVTAQ